MVVFYDFEQKVIVQNFGASPLPNQFNNNNCCGLFRILIEFFNGRALLTVMIVMIVIIIIIIIIIVLEMSILILIY